MSRKRIPGIGKSGIALMRASISTSEPGFEPHEKGPSMKQRVLAAVGMAALWAGIELGACAPALADGAASTRNIIILGTARREHPAHRELQPQSPRKARGTTRSRASPRRVSRLVLSQVRLLSHRRSVQTMVRADVRHETERNACNATGRATRARRAPLGIPNTNRRSRSAIRDHRPATVGGRDRDLRSPSTKSSPG